MQIVIKITKEFEEHFNSDRFEDSLARVASDIESFGFQLAGRYEKETITMLREAIKNGTPLPANHGRLIDADRINLHNISPCDDEMLSVYGATVEDIEEAPTIIEGSDSE